MKKLLFFVIAFSAVFAVGTKPTLAAKSTCDTIQGGTLLDKNGKIITTGYDAWGYNYQARMFNGLYGNFSRPEPPYTDDTLSLIMKWNDAWLSNKSCDDNLSLDRHYGFPGYKGSGAWLTNHIEGTYTSTKKYTSDVSGNWNFNIESTVWPGIYSKTMTIVQDSTGNITGTGFNVPAGYTWNVTGNVSGNTINLSLSYDAPMSGYVATLIGTIASDGTMTGTWSDNWYSDSGSWESTLGNATNTFENCTVSDFVKIVAVPIDSYHDGDFPTPYGEGMWYESLGGAEIGPAIWGDFAVIQEISSDPCDEFNTMNYRSQIKSGLGNW